MNTPESNEKNDPANNGADTTGNNKPVSKSKIAASKVPMLSQAWIDETLRAYGLPPGSLAARAGQQLSATLEAKLIKQTSREKITKLIRSAVSSAIGKDLS